MKKGFGGEEIKRKERKEWKNIEKGNNVLLKDKRE